MRRGQYRYIKHTFNHAMDNHSRNKRLNSNHIQTIIDNSIYYLKNTGDNLEEKMEYLNSLTHDNYRYGTKYKYACNLNKSAIVLIIKGANDNEVFKAYFGESIEEYDKRSLRYVIIGIIIFILVLIIGGLTQ